jgi:peptide deformylase
MDEYNGVGLAAPQVHVSKQLVLVGGEVDEDETPLIRVVINPEITPTTDVLYGMYEGCLSIPGLRGYVERPVGIRVKYLDQDGDAVEEDLEGFPAVVFQHECDHLQGKLYIDRMKDIRKLGYDEEAERYLPVDVTNDGRNC